jgi:hypothetical protein
MHIQRVREPVQSFGVGARRIDRYRQPISRDGDDNARTFHTQSLPVAVLRRFIASGLFLAEN